MPDTFVNAGPCCRCKTNVHLPSSLYEAARASSAITFYCPYGHAQHFAEGESEETKLRRERDILKQQNARLAELRNAAESERDIALVHQQKAVASLKRHKKRSAAGVCPCCNRSFSNMAQHVSKQHPDFARNNGVVIQLKPKKASIQK